MHESEKWKWSRSVAQWPHGLQPTRLLRPWDFPGKSTGVGCHCLLHFPADLPILLPHFFSTIDSFYFSFYFSYCILHLSVRLVFLCLVRLNLCLHSSCKTLNHLYCHNSEFFLGIDCLSLLHLMVLLQFYLIPSSETEPSAISSCVTFCDCSFCSAGL